MRVRSEPEGGGCKEGIRRGVSSQVGKVAVW